MFAPQAISQPVTHPVSMWAWHTETALFGTPNSSSWPKPPGSSLSILLLMPPAIFIVLIPHPPPLLLQTRSSIDLLPTLQITSSVLHFLNFFRPNQFFSATPTQCFSWLPPPPPLAYSTFQSLMTFNNHLYEPAALCRKAGSREAAAAAAAITWPYRGLLLRQ